MVVLAGDATPAVSDASEVIVEVTTPIRGVMRPGVAHRFNRLDFGEGESARGWLTVVLFTGDAGLGGRE